MKISVIIATYNRSDSLRQAMQSIEKMLVPPELSWELIVIDNNSKDHTEEVCNEFQQKRTLPLRYIFEGHQGKSVAVNTGIMESKGDILAFTDDDAIVDTYWLASILKEFENDPSISGVGGRVEPFNECAITFRSYNERILFSSHRQLYNPLIIGVNMAFERRVFDEVGGFDPSLGPGSKIGAIYEDADFVYRVYRKGFKMIYSPDVLVYHNQGLRTEKEIQSVNQRYIIGRGAFYGKHILRADISILLMAFWEMYDIATSLAKNFIIRKSNENNRRRFCNLMTGIIYKARTLNVSRTA